jgi:hypothetical protein
MNLLIAMLTHCHGHSVLPIINGTLWSWKAQETGGSSHSRELVQFRIKLLSCMRWYCIVSYHEHKHWSLESLRVSLPNLLIFLVVQERCLYLLRFGCQAVGITHPHVFKRSFCSWCLVNWWACDRIWTCFTFWIAWSLTIGSREIIVDYKAICKCFNQGR